MESKKMNIVYKKVKDLIPYENNPRNNDEAVDYVAKSIEEFGFKVPCVVSGDGVLITGHTRLKACKKLGIDEVPCIVADDLTEDQIKAFRIADNKVSEYSTWDNTKLAEELSDIMMDMTQFGDDLFKDDDTMDVELPDEENPYSQKKHIPQYEPTGDWYVVIDNEDDQEELYRNEFGDHIIQFDKRDYVSKIDLGDMDTDRRVGVFARNFIQDEAERLGYECHLQLDDDFSEISIRYADDDKLQSMMVTDLDTVFDACLDLFLSTPLTALSFALSSDYIGGVANDRFQAGMFRKTMGSFF